MWQRRRREVNQNALVLILVRDSGGSGQRDSKTSGEKWSDSRYIMKVGPTQFAHQSVCSVRKREIKNGSKDFSLGGEEFPLAKMWKPAGGTDVLGGQEFSFEQAVFE